MRVSKTHYAVLGVLSIGPMSGYEIRQTMQQSTANFWSESDGQLYPALAKLAGLGLVTCTSDKANMREKKIYRITRKGLEHLNKWLEQEPEKHVVRNEFMLKLFFGANVLPITSLEQVRAHRYQTKKSLLQLSETKEKLSKESHNASAHLPYWIMSVQYGIEVAQAKLKWCDDVISQLEKMSRLEKQ